YMSQAYVLLDCEKGKEVVTIQNLGKIVEVIDADILVPSHQIICNVMAPTYTEISDLVTKKIRKLPGIKSTVTLNVIGQKR
ncbi:MAG: AsnC family transcriptional regulator, partial [Nitrosopumilaceae archaeon]|nr:AsnC family transcriptional regulator [Nitrosopumilaceae archaeon]